MKRLIILSLLILSINVIFADCDMAAMMAKTGYSISDLDEGSGDYDDPDEFISFLKTYSTYSTNHDGYGITYIDGDGYFPYINTTDCDLEFMTLQALYLTAQDIELDQYYYNFPGTTTNPYPYQDPMDTAQTIINDDNNDVAIILGHVRRSDTAKGNHPFRFIYDTNTTFQFIHNGGINSDIKIALYNELGANWFSSTNHPSNWWDTDENGTPAYYELIDSEILFHWIMSNIVDCNGDILAGIQNALTATVGSIDLEDEFRTPYVQSGISHNVVNFVLTDGEKLYVFKNGDEAWDHHLLSWLGNDNDSYTVKTRSELDNELGQFDLVTLSRDDDPIVYNDFFDQDVKQIQTGETATVTWLSFPRLTQQGLSGGELYEQAYYENTLPGLLQETSSSLGSIDGFKDIIGYRDGEISIEPIEDDFINNDEGFYNMLFRHEGYKVTVNAGADPTTLVVDGDRLPETYVIDESLVHSQYHWIGYWLPESKNIVDAFGGNSTLPADNFWQYVEKVKAEDWYYDRCSSIRGIGDPQPKTWSTTGKTLEYGKMYMVWFKDQTISDFKWYVSSTVEEPVKKAESESFTFTEKPDYEVIDVIEIPEDILEIGVFQDGVCVGAVTVEDECEQILVYSENANREENLFDFEIVTNSREMNLPINNYLVLNMNSGEFEKGNLIAGHQESSVVKFGDISQPQNETPIIGSLILHGNYPNPFNPTTKISFSLPTSEAIELQIYNVKGQKVKTLYSGFAEAGDHSLIWEGKDEGGRSVSSGIYFYKLKTSSKELTRKMLMMK